MPAELISSDKSNNGEEGNAFLNMNLVSKAIDIILKFNVEK